MLKRIGIDSFSFHRFFGEIAPQESPTDIRWTVDNVLDYAYQASVDSVSLQTVYLPELDTDTVTQLRDKLQTLNLDVTLSWGHRFGLESGTNPSKVDELRTILPIAKSLGCSMIRFVAGAQTSFKLPASERIERLIPIIREIAQLATRYDLMMAIENHSDFAMRDLVALVENVKEDNLGICFDGANAVRVGDDLLEAAKIAAPYVQMVHIRDLRLDSVPFGNPEGAWLSVPVGQGDLDITGLLTIFDNLSHSIDLFVEIAYLHPAFPDEIAAVAESVAYLKRCLDQE